MSEKQASDTPSRSLATIDDYWMALYSRRGLILALAAIAALTSFAISRQATKTYRSGTSFYVLRSVTGAAQSSIAVPYVNPGLVEAFAEILNGRDARTRILEAFPDVEPEDLGNRPLVTTRESGMIKVSVPHPDPQVAADIANAYVDYFREIITAPTLNESKETVSRVQRELDELDTRLEQLRADRRSLVDKSRGASLESELKSLQRNKLQIETRIRETSLRADSAKQEIDSLQLSPLRERRTTLQSQVEGYEITLAGLRGVLAETQARIRRATDLSADLEMSDTAIAGLESRRQTLEQIVNRINVGSLQQRNLEIVTETATPARRHTYPRTARNAAVAGLIGFILGCGYAVVLELRSLRRQEAEASQGEFEVWAGAYLLPQPSTTVQTSVRAS